MEKMPPEIENLVKNIYPDTKTFVAFVMPFLLPVKEKYEKFLLILQKVGITNGIEQFAETITGTVNAYHQAGDEFLGKVITEVKKRLANANITNPQDLQSQLGDLLSIEWIVTNGSEMFKQVQANNEKNFLDINAKVNALPQDEKAIFDFFNVLMLKLWIRKIVTGSLPEEISGNLIKTLLPKYYNSVNALYGAGEIPKDLIDYIETIPIPDEAKWKASMAPPKQEYTPQQNIPTFQRIPEVHTILMHYFDAAQHEALRLLLETGRSNEKLAFKANGNQLADVFKKLYDANLLTGCNKEALISWICTYFKYKGADNNYISFDPEYLVKLISSNARPCKSPILDIKKDDAGKALIFSPERIGRNQE